MSEVKEHFLDLLHLASMAMSNGRSMPSELFIDRASYNKWCGLQEQKRITWLKQEMQRQKLLQIKEKGNDLILNISEKGKVEAIKQEILSERSELPEGTLCLVSFDIPEVARKSRKSFRNFLKKAGFQQLHQSVWRSNRDTVQALRDLVQQLDIGKWVKVFQVTG